MLNLSNQYFKILFNQTLKTPMEVSYEINPFKKLKGGRKNFVYDPRIPLNQQMNPDTFPRGYSRGHLVPSFIMSFDKTAWKYTYYMSNIAVQHPKFNCCSWHDLERNIFDFSRKNRLNLRINTGILDEGKIINDYFISNYFYTKVNTGFEEIIFLGKNDSNGKIEKVKKI